MRSISFLVSAALAATLFLSSPSLSSTSLVSASPASSSSASSAIHPTAIKRMIKRKTVRAPSPSPSPSPADADSDSEDLFASLDNAGLEAEIEADGETAPMADNSDSDSAALDQLVALQVSMQTMKETQARLQQQFNIQESTIRRAVDNLTSQQMQSLKTKIGSELDDLFDPTSDHDQAKKHMAQVDSVELSDATQVTCTPAQTPAAPQPAPQPAPQASGGRRNPCAQDAPGCQPFFPANDAIKLVDNMPQGRTLPPSNAQLSAAWTIAQQHYNPVGNECPIAIHNLFWVYGEDGKVYPTWHPPQFVEPNSNNNGCFFGHEHGDSPAGFRHQNEAIPFGFANEQQLLSSNAAVRSMPRMEDHVGHKIQWMNGITETKNNPADNISATCDCLMKPHMGSYSNDALNNAGHEVFIRCTCTDNRDLNLKMVHFFGGSGYAMVLTGCGPNANKIVQTFAPDTNAILGGGGFRGFTDRACVDSIVAVPQGKTSNLYPAVEHWVIDYGINVPGLSMSFNPYLFVYNPARFMDLSQPTKIGYFSDVCQQNGANQIRGTKACDAMRAAVGGRFVPFSDLSSPWRGTLRSFSQNGLSIQNTSGRSVWYTDVTATQWSATPFPGSIKQTVIGNANPNASLFMPIKDYGAMIPVKWNGFFMDNVPSSEARIHAPN